MQAACRGLRWRPARGSPAPDVSVPAADLAARVGVEAVAFGSGFEAHEVGGPVGRAAVHELVLVLPVGVAEQQRGAAVRPRRRRERDAGVDPILGAVDAAPDSLFRAAFHHFEGCGRVGTFAGIAEVDGQLAADLLVAGDRLPRPPALDPFPGCRELLYALRRRVDREAVQDVGHGVAPHFGSVICWWVVQAAMGRSASSAWFGAWRRDDVIA